MIERIQDAGSSGFIMTGKVLIISFLALNADIYVNWVVSGLHRRLAAVPFMKHWIAT